MHSSDDEWSDGDRYDDGPFLDDGILYQDALGAISLRPADPNTVRLPMLRGFAQPLPFGASACVGYISPVPTSYVGDIPFYRYTVGPTVATNLDVEPRDTADSDGQCRWAVCVPQPLTSQ